MDFDLEMLLYLAIITIGIFVVPMGTESGPPYYLIAGLILISAGIILVYRKIKKK
ncbi:MAG TPA: LPXTG cell wall anchor domain-containing protein [Candidatus Bathyarchaeia archaeon]|nr:LPXTG cell wall anchor domain-containing protein [Candidatus Bathyarchaeia archaeon]